MPQQSTLVVAAVLLPLSGVLLCFLFSAFARGLFLITVALTSTVVLSLALNLPDSGAVRHLVGGWGAPLGIELYADGLAVFLLLTTTLTIAAVAIYGVRYFESPTQPATFWPLLCFLWTALNALFLSGDIFNLYITLELMGLSAVALVALAGGETALTGAMRYLLVTFLGSLSYLLGVALLYHAAGTLDIQLLGERLGPDTTTWIALCLITGAMVLKSALFPLHFWLPPAHSSAPAPVSAVLSGLVVIASFYILLRLWLEVMPEGKAPLGQLLAVLGAIAIVWGSLIALRQPQVKLLVAYSTVAQLGYLFLPFAIRNTELAAAAWRGALYLVLCHALAKAAMFMAVGNVLRFGGHDNIDDQDHSVQRLPATLAAFGLAGVTIIGLPPSGGFLAKWMLLEASVGARQWWLAFVILGGGLLAAAYIFRVVGLAFTEGSLAREPRIVPRPMEWICLGLAFASLVLGIAAVPLLELLDVGLPFGGAPNGVLEDESLSGVSP
ncbi:MAG: proton-conducting transporter membrane subunit [Pseudohongiellaceae bacterium]